MTFDKIDGDLGVGMWGDAYRFQFDNRTWDQQATMNMKTYPYMFWSV